MLTPEQIRAGRGFLDWSRNELAERSGLSLSAIQKIESKSVEAPHPETIDLLEKVFAKHGVEFIGGYGVHFRHEQITRLDGENVFVRLLDDVIATLRDQRDAEALFACVSDRLSPPIVIENYRRLREAGIRMRSLIQEGDKYLLGKPKEYRYLPEKFFHNNATVIYGSKFATMLLDPDTKADVGAVIIRNADIAAAQRNLFNFIWSVARGPTGSTAEVRYDE